MIKNILYKIIILLLPIKKNRISIIDLTCFSGSNSYALYEFILNNENINKYEVKLISNNSISFKEKIENFLYKVSSKIIITTHSAKKYRKNQLIIQLWHGIPLKSMGLLDNTYSNEWIKNDKKIFDDVSIIASTSKMYNTLLNSTIGQPGEKYRVTGYPRNDYLLREYRDLSLNDIFKDIDEKNKNIFYIPTFKNGYGQRNEGNDKSENFFGFDVLEIEKFSDFLVRSNINLILKLHPFEEEFYKNKFNSLKLKNIYFLDSDILIKNKIDLYKLLTKSDLLITDYSSVYFDYLITNKPILFINPDEDEYRQTRGFLLEPYSYWTPGPKVNNQQDLQKEILNLLNSPGYYMEERRTMSDIFHCYKDDNSCKRVWDSIKLYLD